MLTLPPPATTVEIYLAAILEELGALRADLARRQPLPPSDDQVVLREPTAQTPPAKRGRTR